MSLIITIISFFIPSQIRISKAVQINAPKDSVMTQIREPLNWKNWYPGFHSTNVLFVEGIVNEIVYVNSGQLLIDKKTDDEVSAEFIGTNKKIIITGWKIISNDSNSVTLEWYIDFHMRWYPWEKFSSFMFEKIYNPQLEKGLNNLKTFLEK